MEFKLCPIKAEKQNFKRHEQQKQAKYVTSK